MSGKKRDATTGLERLLEAKELFSSKVAVQASAMKFDLTSLLPEERVFVASAGRGRQVEFATGRVLARELIASFGLADLPLLKDLDGLPIWPDGLIGSISHKKHICVVAVAASQARARLGIDIELDEPVRPGVEMRICRPTERKWIAEADDADEVGRRCRMIFCAKEATYKAFFPRVRKVWGFQDVGIEIDLVGCSFRADLPPNADCEEIEGTLYRRDGWLLAGVESD